MSKAVIDALVERFPDVVHDPYVGVGGDDCAFVKKAHLPEVCRFLKQERGFDMAPYITAVDYLGQDPRFEVVYVLYATKANERIRLRVKVSEQDCTIPTVTSVWRGADWFERHPLRKDYPLKGRQPLVPEREVRDIFRGPGPATRD
jgi:NADH-quinone oxidoreductase subunit C